ncbi:MAG: inositol monophosphatase family protein, partial [Pseudomonadota bacterium]
IVALLVDGQTTAGWIHLPLEPRTCVTIRGRGALNSVGSDLEPAPARPIDQLYGQFNIPSKTRKPALATALGGLSSSLRKHDANRCSAYAYCGLADGSIDFLIYQNLKPWDHAAGILMVEELGGLSAHLSSGEAYLPTDSTGPLIIAGSSETPPRIRAHLTAAAA